MKYFGTILFLVFSITSFAQEKAIIGMTLNEVMKIYPSINSDTNENGITLSKPDTIYGLDDNWGYRFKKDTLDWIFFMKYFNEINEANFNKCLSATKKIIKDFTAFYGKPDTTIIGNTTFVNPYVKHHWGYDVMEARWKNYKGMKMKVEFTFMGGKGEYAFLVQINFFDKDYPYYE